MSRMRAFTIVELMVVITIVVVLIALLLPNLTRARATVRAVQCRSNLHQTGVASSGFWADHLGSLPGVWYGGYAGSEPWQRAWLRKEVYSGYPDDGVLLPYIGDRNAAEKLYRCPGLEKGEFHSGVGSNGMFDYTMVQAFSGAKMFNLPRMATLQHPVTSQLVDMPAPLKN